MKNKTWLATAVLLPLVISSTLTALAPAASAEEHRNTAWRCDATTGSGGSDAVCAYVQISTCFDAFVAWGTAPRNVDWEIQYTATPGEDGVVRETAPTVTAHREYGLLTGTHIRVQVYVDGELFLETANRVSCE